MTTPANPDDLITWLRAQLDDDERNWLPTLRGPKQNGKTFALRMLREVDAKRRILDEHAPDQHGYCPTCCDNTVESPCHTLMCLAPPYADRPGYREEWKP